ncbi:MAG: DUF4221 family protein [Algoriphagus sp.]|uniref:DUF4221 family protein n=1 Tax=Algoriphagus sp. TaxID=1872435 RepID=UPI002634E244|nr:DUF4221 family protein [Algoriphagus sp.]MDG1277917.1 DUF4221 family protein [Algoriphagus sp.]
MRKQLPIFVLAILVSCGGKQVNEKVDKKTFTFSAEIDTVKIDFKDRFYFMEIYLGTAAVSPDKKTLYNLNDFAPNLEIIDLDQQEMSSIEPMDKEGPLGIGPVTFSIAITPSDELVLKGMDEVRIFDKSRTQLKIIKISSKHLEGEVLEVGERYGFDGIFTEKADYFFTIYQNEAGMSQGELKGLTIIDLNTSTIRKIPIPELDRIKDFYLQDQYGNFRGDDVLLTSFQNKVIVSTSAINEAFVYDIALDTLIQKKFHSKLTADTKRGDYPRNFSYESNWRAVFAERSKEVEFGKFIYDEENDKFWRFSYELDRMIGDSIVRKTVLTVFDSKLNQLHEEKVPFDYSYYQSFFKDGMLYSYINLEDEMAFIRVKPTY